MALVEGLSRREISRRTGLHRNTVRDAIERSEPRKYERPAAGSKLDPFKDEIHRLLADRQLGRLSGVRIGELLEPLGWEGGKTILDDYLREVRPLFEAPRTFQRTVYRPGEIVQFDVWELAREVPVGHGQTRKGFVVVACLGYSRIGAGALVFSKQAPDLLAGIRRCLWQLGGVAQTMVWDRQAGLHASGGRPTVELAALLGELGMGFSARRRIRRPRVLLSGCRALWRPVLNRGACSRTSWTASCSSMSGLPEGAMGGAIARCVAGRWTARRLNLR